MPQCAHGYLSGAVAPTTGDNVWRALPWLNTSTYQLWIKPWAEAVPQSCNLRVRDKGALHKAKAWPWPAHVMPVLLPPYSPERKPRERLRRDRKSKWAACGVQTRAAWSAVSGRLRHSYSQTTRQTLTGSTYVVQAIDIALPRSMG